MDPRRELAARVLELLAAEPRDVALAALREVGQALDGREYLPVAEVASKLAISRATLYRRATEARVTIAGGMVRREDVERLFAAGQRAHALKPAA